MPGNIKKVSLLTLWKQHPRYLYSMFKVMFPPVPLPRRWVLCSTCWTVIAHTLVVLGCHHCDHRRCMVGLCSKVRMLHTLSKDSEPQRAHWFIALVDHRVNWSLKIYGMFTYVDAPRNSRPCMRPKWSCRLWEPGPRCPGLKKHRWSSWDGVKNVNEWFKYLGCWPKLANMYGVSWKHDYRSYIGT